VKQFVGYIDKHIVSLDDWLTVLHSITFVDLQLIHKILVYLHIMHLLKSSIAPRGLNRHAI